MIRVRCQFSLKSSTQGPFRQRETTWDSCLHQARDVYSLSRNGRNRMKHRLYALIVVLITSIVMLEGLTHEMRVGAAFARDSGRSDAVDRNPYDMRRTGLVRMNRPWIRFDFDEDGHLDTIRRESRFSEDGLALSRFVVESGIDDGATELASFISPERGDLFGWVVADIGDVDFDDVRDFAVAAPDAKIQPHRGDHVGNYGVFGRVYLVSGASGETILSIDGQVEGRFALALATVDDLNGDGLFEVLIAGLRPVDDALQYLRGFPREEIPLYTVEYADQSLNFVRYWTIASSATGEILRQGYGNPSDRLYNSWERHLDLWRNSVVPGDRLRLEGTIEDLNADGRIDRADVILLQQAMGEAPGAVEDLNGDGVVDVVDLELLNGAFGTVLGSYVHLQEPESSDFPRFAHFDDGGGLVDADGISGPIATSGGDECSCSPTPCFECGCDPLDPNCIFGQDTGGTGAGSGAGSTGPSGPNGPAGPIGPAGPWGSDSGSVGDTGDTDSVSCDDTIPVFLRLTEQGREWESGILENMPGPLATPALNAPGLAFTPSEPLEPPELADFRSSVSRIVWVNSDDDNMNGRIDKDDTEASTGAVGHHWGRVDAEDDFVGFDIIQGVNPSGSNMSWWALNVGGGRVWWKRDNPTATDEILQCLGEPEVTCDEQTGDPLLTNKPLDPSDYPSAETRVINGDVYELLRSNSTFFGDPMIHNGHFYWEQSGRNFELDESFIALSYIVDGGIIDANPDPEIVDLQRKFRKYYAFTPVTGVELEMHDLRAWGPARDPVSGVSRVGNQANNWAPDLDTGHASISGAITDGASICLLRFDGPDPTAETDPLHTMLVDVKKRDDQIDRTILPPPSFWASRQIGGTFFPVDHDAFGSISVPDLPISTSGAADFVDGQLNTNSGSEGRGKLFYIPPESFVDPSQFPFVIPETSVPTGQATSGYLSHTIHENVRMAFMGTLPGIGNVPGSRSFILRRPPLVLVHGIESSPAIWDRRPWSESLAPEKIRTRIYRTDWSTMNRKGFAENYPKLVLSIESALTDYRMGDDGTGHIFNFGGMRFAATKVDVVGHSQGGLLARWYIADTTAGQPTTIVRPGWNEHMDNFRSENDSQGRRPFLRDNNWGSGDVRRLITLNTPHQGSLLSDLGEPFIRPGTPTAPARSWSSPMHAFVSALNPRSEERWRETQLRVVVTETQAANPDIVTEIAYVPSGMETTYAYDLQSTSAAIVLLRNPSIYPSNGSSVPFGARRVPFYPISTEVALSSGQTPSLWQRWPYFFEHMYLVYGKSLETKLSATNSDWVVSVRSQKNISPAAGPGFQPKALATHFTGLHHSRLFNGGDSSSFIVWEGVEGAAQTYDDVRRLIGRPLREGSNIGLKNTYLLSGITDQ